LLSLKDIRAAQQRIRDAVFVSPCPYTRTLSERTGCSLYLKLENLQMTGSFKERGACNKLTLLDEDERARGIVAASAGNHAQGVAYHARRLGIDALVVMPKGTPLIKVTSTQRLGARVLFHGDSYDDAFAEAVRIAADDRRTLVHAFDDWDVMAGQGTLGLEVLDQVPNVDTVVVAAGGGGLAAGVATAIKETRPEVRVVGVEAAHVPSLRAALDAGSPVTVDALKTLAEGVAVRRVGERSFALAQRYLDDVVSVSEGEIAEAILMLLEEEKTVAEGAGAAPLAALLHRKIDVENKCVVVVVGGGNIDVHRVARVIERGLLKSGRLRRMRILLPDVPGALAQLLRVVAELGANLMQVHHDRLATQLEMDQAAVELVVETRGFEHCMELEAALVAQGYQVS
jgi:threonine dehydratase